MTTTYLIVPALTDQAGQCRIVRTTTQLGRCRPLDHYRRWPDDWSEVGLMSSRGYLVCLDAPAGLAADMREDQPLMAGLVYTTEE
jgi:hypothetical protein